MTNQIIPDGYHTVTPYLVIPRVARLIEFLEQAFGAAPLHRLTRPDGTIINAHVRIGDSLVMMGEPKGDFRPIPGSIYLYVEDADALYQRALAAGATSIMEPVDQYWGDRMAGVQDPSGNFWWIATHIEEIAPAEMQRRAAVLDK